MLISTTNSISTTPITTNNNNNNTTTSSVKCSDFSVSSICRDLRNSPDNVKKSAGGDLETGSAAVIIGGTGGNWKLELPPPPTLATVAASNATVLPPTQPAGEYFCI